MLPFWVLSETNTHCYSVWNTEKLVTLILVLKNRNLVTVWIWTPNAQIPNSFEIWWCLLFRFWMVTVICVQPFKFWTQWSFLWLFTHLVWISSYALKTRPLKMPFSDFFWNPNCLTTYQLLTFQNLSMIHFRMCTVV